MSPKSGITHITLASLLPHPHCTLEGVSYPRHPQQSGFTHVTLTWTIVTMTTRILPHTGLSTFSVLGLKFNMKVKSYSEAEKKKKLKQQHAEPQVIKIEVYMWCTPGQQWFLRAANFSKILTRYFEVLFLCQLYCFQR